MRNNKTPLRITWLVKMAWRDSRTHRKRLFLFMTAIVLGIASLVSIGSFGQNLEHAIDGQAKTLLGADLLFSRLQPYPTEVQAVIDSIGGEQAQEVLFGSMAYLPRTGDTRLVQVRGLRGNFPFYGEIETEPPAAAQTYKSGRNALLDETLMLQYNVAPGDSIKIGDITFHISGTIKKLPSEPPIASTFSPRVYVPLNFLEETDLLQRGSLVRYRVYFRFGASRDVDKLVSALRPFLNKHRIQADTVASRKQQIGDVMTNLYHFLNLVGFVALILGCIGVASAVHVYTRQKLESVAILRCLGARAKQAFYIYLIQIGLMALLGSVLGATLGLGLQIILPDVFGDFLPVRIEHSIVWAEVLQGIAIGFGLALLFALIPLVGVRKISPLLALRASYESAGASQKARSRWLVYASVVLATALFAVSQFENWRVGLGFIAAMLVAFAVLSGTAKLITFSLKRFFPKSWTYVWRQGLANLYRPNNQTLVLMLSIGLGTFLITTLYLSHNTLLNKVTYAAGGNRPNLILFDIQPDQIADVRKTVTAQGLPILQEAPMITMRLTVLKGELIEDILSDSTRDVSRGLLRWEFRTTYRDTLFESEKVVAGVWIGRLEEEQSVIPISFEEGAAQRLLLSVGDTLVWNVQGVPLTTRIASLRKVDWQRIQANFMVVFPQGALEYAPQIYILATKAPTTARSADLQRILVRSFPNVSIIDLALVLSTLDGFLSKISFVIRFMAFFSIFTGLIVLTSAVITSRYQRVQESVLLRTLGASRKQVVKIMAVEYIFLGGLAALTGLLLSYAGGWALAYFVFDSLFLPTVLPFLIVLVLVTGVTVLIGMLNSRGILDRPPLEVMRTEAV